MRIYAITVQFLPVSPKTKGETCRILDGGWLFLQIAIHDHKRKATATAGPRPPANNQCLERLGNNFDGGFLEMKFIAHSVRFIRKRTWPRVRRGELKECYFRLGLVIVPVLLFFSGSKLLAATTKPDAKRSIKRIRAIVDRFRQDLSIREKVSISIVAKNDKLVSVERSKAKYGGFILSFDETFLNSLDDNELNASIAHELGHVWIFTHHPYLQTELLANQIALQVVSREELERIYAKVWKNNGDVDIKQFLGEDTAVGLKPEIRIKSLPRATDRLSHP